MDRAECLARQSGFRQTRCTSPRTWEQNLRIVMAWIESHQSLGRHPKMVRLSARVGVCRPQVIRHLQYLWWWTLDYAPDGNHVSGTTM